MIQFEHVSYTYERTTRCALDDVSLRIDEGAFVAVVGHNGSGKSTLAKHINGLLLPTKGAVTINGMTTQNEDNILPIRQMVGMIFQNPDNQLVTTIVEEDVAFGPENVGVAPEQIRKNVDAALQKVGMTAYATRAVHSLSGGQKQRIAIAGMLALNPSILVLDEATAMLDPKGRAGLVATMHDLNKKGITIVMVTQYMEEVVGCDRVIMMRDGAIVKDDTPVGVFSDETLLHECGLDVPETVKIRNALRAEGLPLSDAILTTEALAEALCPLL